MIEVPNPFSVVFRGCRTGLRYVTQWGVTQLGVTLSDAEKLRYDLTGLRVQAFDSIRTRMNRQIQNHRSSVTQLHDVMGLGVT